MILITFAGLVGGIATGALTWPSGIFPALFMSSMAGSGFAAFAAIIVMARRGEDWATGEDFREPADEMVTRLRDVAARGRALDGKEPSEPKRSRAA
jgi:formate-dependent nitrite reductase membrane component NrfD